MDDPEGPDPTALTARGRTTRHKVYKQFIEEASKLYGNALVNTAVEIPSLRAHQQDARHFVPRYRRKSRGRPSDNR